MTTKIRRASVVGLGKLGSPIVASFASRGYETIGIDVNSAFVEALAAGRAPVNETGLQQLIDKHSHQISATTDWNELVQRSDASFIVVPTPSQADGAFSNRFVVDACEKLGAALRSKSGFHLIVVVSTMMPGSSEKEVIPALERASGKKVGKGFGYCYSPTLIALGSVIRNFLHPDLIMIGESDRTSGAMLETFYRTVVGEAPAIHRVNPREAELAKISINTFVTTKISFANMLGMVAEGIGGIDVDRVTAILGSDARIGAKYLMAGGSYGGPCFPRDNRAFTRAADEAGVETHIPRATDATNRQQIASVASRVAKALGGVQGCIGIVGAAYKLDTDVVEEAMGIRLACALLKDGHRVVIHDPLALDSARKALGENVNYAETPEECFAMADAIVVTNAYQSMAPQIAAEAANGKPVIDIWRVLSNGAVKRRAPGRASRVGAKGAPTAAPRPATMTASESPL